MDQASAFSFSTVDVLRAAERESVLALIVGTQGPSYRPVGAVMRFFADRTSIGTLSSGCIEADLALQAHDTLRSGRARLVRYGQGSPYMDIKLPCGGGLEIFLLPRPCEATLGAIVERLDSRMGVSLFVDLISGALSLSGTEQPHRTESSFAVYYGPEPKFIVFGKGPEAAMFTALTETLGFPNVLLSPDLETLEMAGQAEDRRLYLPQPSLPETVLIDPSSAVLLFFHDHDWEPPILMASLQSEAFYIGAQGSLLARQQRDLELKMAGASAEQLQRIRGPIGLIPSVRDPRSLAVSVLAEVLKVRPQMRNQS